LGGNYINELVTKELGAVEGRGKKFVQGLGRGGGVCIKGTVAQK